MIVGAELDAVVAQILVYGKRVAPEEACGIVLLDQPKPLVIQLINCSSEPETSYKLGNEELAMKLSPETPPSQVVIWHTHPGGNVGPSQQDLRQRYPHADLKYLVVALPNGEAAFF